MLTLLLACATDTPAVAESRGPAPAGDAAAPIADAPVPAPAVAPEAAPLTADTALTRAKSRAPAGFTVVPAGPFVVIGNEAPAKVRERARRMGDVVAALHTDYFPKDPAVIWEAWLFADDDSYVAGAKSVFGDEPDTPYGYASEADHALVMNVGTGGGTLVHEMVHPYMFANFPEAPTWFDEGLASLYEHVGIEHGHLVGYVNWRLKGLHAAIGAKSLPDFPSFFAQDTGTFYGSDRGDNYAQARYLCQWLQDHGKLHTFYATFHASVAEDPTGVESLRTVLGTHDLAAFQREWEAWALGLKG